MQWQRIWFFKRRIPEPTQFFALGVLYLWAQIPNNQFLIGQPMGTSTNGYQRNNPPGLPLIGLDNRAISHSHREGLQGVVLWLVDQWFSDSRPCAKFGDTNPNCPLFWKYIFLFMLWNPMVLLTALCRWADVYFLGDRLIGQQLLIGSQTFLYLITWYLFYTRFSKNTWTLKINLFLIKYLLSWFNKIN